MVFAAGLIQVSLNFSKQDTLRLENGKLIALERVSTPESLRQGLSGRPSLASNKGMLFVFETADKHCFWMKNTLIPLDIIWLDASRQIVHIEENVQPSTYPDSFCPARPALYVIEINAGAAKQHNLKLGQQAQF